MPKKQTNFFDRIKPARIEIFLILLALFPALYIAFGNPNTILDWYSSDDGFLYFQVARNLAAGHGFTFDGINPTNGFHPLWLILITPVFALAQLDLLLPLRVLVIISALVSAGSAILLYRILKQFASDWLAVFVGLLWIVLPRIHDLTMHAGVEAGINAFTLLLFWRQLILFKPNSVNRNMSSLVVLGLLGILAIFARLDNIFLIGLGGLWLWLCLWQPPMRLAKAVNLRTKPLRASAAKRGNPQHKGLRAQNPWIWRLQTGFAFFSPIALALGLYLAWNYLSFGTFAPISGDIKLWWGTLKNTVYGFPVKDLKDFGGQFFTNDPELGPWSLVTAPFYSFAEWLLGAMGQAVSVAARRIVLLATGGILAALVAGLIWIQRQFLVKVARNLGLLPFFLGCFAQIAYYKFAGSVAQQPWYWISEMIFLLIVLGLLIEALLRVAARALSARLERVAGVVGIAILGLASLLFLAFIQTAVRAPGDGSNHFYIDRAHWLEANTEEGAQVAITGAGNLAYFIEDRTIINMDGLMNTHDYLLALQSGKGAQYLASLDVDYIFGNEYILTETNPYAPMLVGHLQPYKVYVFADRELPLWRFLQ